MPPKNGTMYSHDSVEAIKDEIRAAYQTEIVQLRAAHQAELDRIRQTHVTEMQSLRDECAVLAKTIAEQKTEILQFQNSVCDIAFRFGYEDVQALLVGKEDPPIVVKLKEENERLLELATSPKRDRRTGDRG
mgnify:FL=1